MTFTPGDDGIVYLLRRVGIQDHHRLPSSTGAPRLILHIHINAWDPQAASQLTITGEPFAK